MRVQLREHLREVLVKQIYPQLDILDVAPEQHDEELLVHEVREADECFGLAAVDEQRACEEAQILSKQKVRKVKVKMSKADYRAEHGGDLP